jgi:SAM-dependent methyltransferase
VLGRRWRDTRSRKPALAAAREILSDVWEFTKELTPQRRRSLYGDAEYDWDHATNTTSGGVSTRTRLLAAISGAAYQPTEPGVFREMIHSLEMDVSEFVFVDLGSGKGRTLLMAAEFPFWKIIGVELLPELHEVAIANIALSKDKRLQALCLDARAYEFPEEPLVVFLFNPLPAAALEEVIANLKRSGELSPRAVRVIYHNPISEDVLAGSMWLRKVKGTQQFAIYSN